VSAAGFELIGVAVGALITGAIERYADLRRRDGWLLPCAEGRAAELAGPKGAVSHLAVKWGTAAGVPATVISLAESAVTY
jgi:hypothetical protein